MEGGWGFGYCIQGGAYYERVLGGVSYSMPYPGTDLCRQITEDFDVKPSWIIVGLFMGASGHKYTSPHPILSDASFFTENATNIVNITPSGPAEGMYDNFFHIVQSMKACGIKIIAYMASEGPEQWKNGQKGSSVDKENKAAVKEAWLEWVATQYESPYGTVEADGPQQYRNEAYAVEIVGHYAKRFGSDIDGWWFDHCNPFYCNKALITQLIKAANPNAQIALNVGKKIPLTQNSPGYETFTFGHPSPVKSTPPWDCNNYKMVTCVEESISGDGYINHKYNAATNMLEPANETAILGHLLLPTSASSWNGVGGAVGWTQTNGGPGVSEAANWFQRVTNNGGALTWNIPSATNNFGSGNPPNTTLWGLLDQAHVDFVRDTVNLAAAASIADSGRCSYQACDLVGYTK